MAHYYCQPCGKFSPSKVCKCPSEDLVLDSSEEENIAESGDKAVGPLDFPCSYCKVSQVWITELRPDRADEASYFKLECRACKKVGQGVMKSGN